MKEYKLNKEILLSAIAINFNENEIINVKLTLLDKEKKVLGEKTSNCKVKDKKARECKYKCINFKSIDLHYGNIKFRRIIKTN